MMGHPFKFTGMVVVEVFFLLSAFIGFDAGARAEDICLEHARELLYQIPLEQQPELKIDASLNNPEAFSIRYAGNNTQIFGGGSAGVLYGVGQWLAQPAAAATSGVERPDFALRGTALFLMKDGSYDYQLTPQEFPWFFDRPLLTQYLDCLQANRFNTIFLWSGHMFPSIASMPEYPDATDLKPEELARNQQQFRWFTDECAKRNIRVLMHFYQIHIPRSLAKSRNIPMHYNVPNDFVKKYVRYALGRFLSEFNSVGLYVCPGEVLDPKYSAEWIRDVILAAAKESNQNPTIVIRAWGLDAEGFKKLCVPEYDNLYTELKHNVEMVVSPVPDPYHANWINVAKKHIVNVHEVSDLKPFRWGSPQFIHEMVGEWKRAGLDGAECYGMVSWRWPYSLDKLEPQQASLWPQGKKLLSFQRDAIWFEALGRYLWKVDRPQAEETAYWTTRFAEKFGSQAAAEQLLKWYDITGPVLPGLQNLTHVHNMNCFPTVIGKEQVVDAILDTAACTRDYPSRPVDSFFFERYKQKYGMPELTNRVTMPIDAYADKLAEGQSISDVMVPDKVVDLLVEMTAEGCRLAESAQSTATRNQEEAARFVTDSQALAYVAQAWQHKVHAAIAKRCYQKTKDEKYARSLLDHLQHSVEVYEKLVALTDKTYVNATDALMWLNWHEGLKAFQKDQADQKKFLESSGLQTSFINTNKKEVSPDEFIISFWHGPSPDNITPERFKEIADAGFNLVMPHCAFPPTDEAKSINLKILDLCAKYGLKAIILDERIHSSKADPKAKDFSEKLAAAVSDYASHPALYGYDVADEPGTGAFPRVAAICQALLSNDPKHLPYVNLLPIHAVGGPPFINDDAQFPRIAKDYDNYLEQYMTQVKPKLLSYDEYDLIESGGPIPLEGHGMLGMYFPNLEKIREKSLKYQLPFTNIILVTPHLHAFGTYRDPTFAELRFLVYTTLAYGGRGIMYFTYESVTQFGTDAIIKKDGTKSNHYDEVKRLNHEIRALAPVLCTLHSDGVYHVGRMPKQGQSLPKDGLIKQLEGADAVVSYYSDAKGSRYLMIVNKDYAQDHSITITFPQPVQLEIISPSNGQPEGVPHTSVEKDRPDTFAISFGAGEGKLFKIGDLKMNQSKE